MQQNRWHPVIDLAYVDQGYTKQVRSLTLYIAQSAVRSRIIWPFDRVRRKLKGEDDQTDLRAEAENIGMNRLES